MNEIKMEEMGQIEAFCELIVNEIFEIKMHICNERYFEGGVGLGGLLNSVINRQMQEKHVRKKNKEVQDFFSSHDEECDEECEESEEEKDYKAMYIEKFQEFLDQREELMDLRAENNILNLLKKQSFDLLQELYDNDQMFLEQREQLRQLLLKVEITDSTLWLKLFMPQKVSKMKMEEMKMEEMAQKEESNEELEESYEEKNDRVHSMVHSLLPILNSERLIIGHAAMVMLLASKAQDAKISKEAFLQNISAQWDELIAVDHNNSDDDDKEDDE